MSIYVTAYRIDLCAWAYNSALYGMAYEEMSGKLANFLASPMRNSKRFFVARPAREGYWPLRYSTVGPMEARGREQTSEGPLMPAAGTGFPTCACRSSASIPIISPEARCGRPGEPQTFFATESQMDCVARRLGMVSLEFRRKNLIEEGEPTATGEQYQEIRAKEMLDAAVKAAGYDAPKASNVGRGIAMGTRGPGGGATSLTVELRPDGAVNPLHGGPRAGYGDLYDEAQIRSCTNGYNNPKCSSMGGLLGAPRPLRPRAREGSAPVP
jgi:hypothetical protein